MGLNHLKDFFHNQTHCSYEDEAIPLDKAKIKMDTMPPKMLGYV